MPYAVDLVKHLYYRACMQHVSKQFHEDIQTASPGQFAIIFDTLLCRMPDLVMNSVGSRTARKLASIANPNQRLSLLEALKPKLDLVACCRIGSLGLQAILEILTSPEELHLLFRILHPHLDFLMMDQYGHYILEKLLGMNHGGWRSR
jgi:hypothetical protein